MKGWAGPVEKRNPYSHSDLERVVVEPSNPRHFFLLEDPTRENHPCFSDPLVGIFLPRSGFD